MYRRTTLPAKPSLQARIDFRRYIFLTSPTARMGHGMQRPAGQVSRRTQPAASRWLNALVGRWNHFSRYCGFKRFDATLPSVVYLIPIVPGAYGDSCGSSRGGGKYQTFASGDIPGTAGAPRSTSTLPRSIPISILENKSRGDLWTRRCAQPATSQAKTRATAVTPRILRCAFIGFRRIQGNEAGQARRATGGKNETQGSSRCWLHGLVSPLPFWSALV
jgi:hypothetical protein